MATAPVDLDLRLTRIEALLQQVLNHLQKRRRIATKRTGTAALHVIERIEARGFEPTAAQEKRARRVLSHSPRPLKYRKK